jgi:hypothetical protein
MELSGALFETHLLHLACFECESECFPLDSQKPVLLRRTSKGHEIQPLGFQMEKSLEEIPNPFGGAEFGVLGSASKSSRGRFQSV